MTRLNDINLSYQPASTIIQVLNDVGSNITNIDLEGNNFGEKGGQFIAKALSNLLSLRYINISHCRLGDLGTIHFLSLSSNFTNITILNLESNNIGIKGAEAIASAILFTKEIKILNLGYNNLQSTGTGTICNNLKTCTQLEHLYLGGNNCGADGAVALATALDHMPTLLHLDLTNNNITDVGINSLALYLQQNKFLTELHVARNNITTAGHSFLKQHSLHNLYIKIYSSEDGLFIEQNTLNETLVDDIVHTVLAVNDTILSIEGNSNFNIIPNFLPKLHRFYQHETYIELLYNSEILTEQLEFYKNNISKNQLLPIENMFDKLNDIKNIYLYKIISLIKDDELHQVLQNIPYDIVNEIFDYVSILDVIHTSDLVRTESLIMEAFLQPYDNLGDHTQNL